MHIHIKNCQFRERNLDFGQFRKEGGSLRHENTDMIVLTSFYDLNDDVQICEYHIPFYFSAL